jgi:hypothetical protein
MAHKSSVGDCPGKGKVSRSGSRDDEGHRFRRGPVDEFFGDGDPLTNLEHVGPRRWPVEAGILQQAA